MKDVLKNIYEHTLLMTPIDTTPFTSEHIEPIAFYLGQSPKSLAYGKIYGCFRYKPTNHYYMIHFHVHRPNQRYAHLSNHMETIELCEFDEYGLHFPVKPTMFGNHAFWQDLADKDLVNQDDIDLRHLMRQLKQYSVTQKLCKQFRKTDKAHLQHNGRISVIHS